MTMELTQELVARLIDYDPHRGTATWRARWPELFAHGRVPPEPACLAWNNRYAGRVAFTSKDRHGYFRGKIMGREAFAHRLFWFLSHGEWPEMIDHINRNRADNRLCNLRAADRLLNARNSKNCKSADDDEFGIYLTPHGHWRVTFWFNGRSLSVGTWTTRAEAVAARNAARTALGRFDRDGRFAECVSSHDLPNIDERQSDHD